MRHELLHLEKPNIFHLVVTAKCQGKCKGCINTLSGKDRLNLISEWEINPDQAVKILLELKSTLHIENGRPLYIAFYGGEPLLEIEKIIQIIDKLKEHGNFKYILYTNGLLLRNLLKFANFLNDFLLINISIDGRKEQHERVRPGLKYEIILSNLAVFKEKAKIPVIMWSTLREEQNFLDCIFAFLENYEKGLIDYFFWHFLESSEDFKNFKAFYKSYEDGLKFLLGKYLENLKNGKVLPFLPLNELIFIKLTDQKREGTACQVELLKNFDVVGDKVVPCIDMPEDFYFAKNNGNGGLSFKERSEIEGFLKNLIKYKEELGCFSCEAHFYCGGRCPVQAISSFERTKGYCELTRLFVRQTEFFFEEIKTLLLKRISLEEFYWRFVFPVYFTDVVP